MSEDILKAFGWQDFELFIMEALSHYGYNAHRTFRFSINKKRYEVDVLGRDKNTIFFIDGKHWNSKTTSTAALTNAADKQKKRAIELRKDPIVVGRLLQDVKYPFPNHKIIPHQSFKIYPIIVISSNSSKYRIINGVAIVPISQFLNFLNLFIQIKPNLCSVDIKKFNYQKKLI